MQLHFGAKRTGCVPGGECVAAMGGATFETADLPLYKFAKLIARKKRIVHFLWILPEKSVEITLTVILGPVEWVLDQLNGSGRAGVGW